MQKNMTNINELNKLNLGKPFKIIKNGKESILFYKKEDKLVSVETLAKKTILGGRIGFRTTKKQQAYLDQYSEKYPFLNTTVLFRALLDYAIQNQIDPIELLIRTGYAKIEGVDE